MRREADVSGEEFCAGHDHKNRAQRKGGAPEKPGWTPAERTLGDHDRI